MRYSASIVFILFAFFGTAAAGDADIVTLKAEATISGDSLLLGDIATVQGPHAQELALLSLAKAPRNGPGATLSSQFVASKIKEKIPGSVVAMAGAPHVSVCAKQAKITGAELEALFRDAVARANPHKDRGTLEISNIRVPANLSVAVKDKDLLQAKFSPGEDFLGLVTATITAGDRPSEICRVSGKVRVMAQVPVVSRAIRRGAVIQEGDLELKAMDLSTSPHMVRDMKECLGMRAKTALPAGKPVLRTNIAQPPLISRGDIVAIEARSDELVIMDRGIALKDGCLGDMIPVRNAGSGKQVVGTIIAHSQVEVLF